MQAKKIANHHFCYNFKFYKFYSVGNSCKFSDLNETESVLNWSTFNSFFWVISVIIEKRQKQIVMFSFKFAMLAIRPELHDLNKTEYIWKPV